MSEIYDVVIIGGGPSGLTAALYNARARLKTVVLEKTKIGGQIALTHEIANFPGAIEGKDDKDPSGPALVKRMADQATKYGAEIHLSKDVKSIELEGKIKRVICSDGTVYDSHAVICANGAQPRPIGCEGEKDLQGKGVSYCATCDGAFFEDLEVYVVGGGNSAVEEAEFITSFARKVTILQNLPHLTADEIAIEQAKKNPKIDYIFNTVIDEIRGDGLVESMVIRNTETGETTEILADEDDGTFGIFVFIGYIPNTDLYKGVLELDDWGYIKTKEDMSTSLPGVFASGDIRPKTLRQVITAAGDGATAAHSAQKYVELTKS